jgi:isopenicillin-N epimerase
MNSQPSDLIASIHADAWGLDPAVAMLNHGSFGACPLPVLARQTQLRQQLEAEPVRFLVRELPALWDESRRTLAELVGAAGEDVVFVANATAGVNAVLRSLRFRPGDELLVTNHGYNACSNVVRYVAQREGAEVVTADVPIPVESPRQVVEAVLARVTARTRLALIDHVTSPTAIVFPVDEIVRELNARGVDALIDGAHAPGMLPLDLARLGAAYYTGNLHKWLCGPKAAGFLHVRPDRQEGIEPPVISHGLNQSRPGYSRLQDAFDWQGTADPSPWLCVGPAIRFLAGLLPTGLAGLLRRNHALAVAAQRLLCARLALRPICPEEMLGSMAAVLLPPRTTGTLAMDAESPVPLPRLGRELLQRMGIEVPVYYWPAAPQAVLRVSAQAYNGLAQYERLAEALETLLPTSVPRRGT